MLIGSVKEGMMGGGGGVVGGGSSNNINNNSNNDSNNINNGYNWQRRVSTKLGMCRPQYGHLHTLSLTFSSALSHALPHAPLTPFHFHLP